jgi:crotonobetainyl-CoA:carnitine CoA-transferase CaiB-like acyl-CoA transferase
VPQYRIKAQRFLEGVRVIDLSQYIPGPFATRQLSDLGADVVKVEPPGGDPMRQFMHQSDPGGQASPIYRHLNRGKRIVTLDLKSGNGKRVFTRLVAGADILLESFRPGVLARLGFDRQTFDKINPRLILCSLSGYGQNGPYRLRAGHDVNYCSLTSMQILNGTTDAPVIGFPPLADHAGAMQASIAMLAALHARNQHDCGAYLDISLFETSLSWQYLPLLVDGVERAQSLLNGGAACYNIYQCADGNYFSLGALETHFWNNFCAALQNPGWKNRQFESMPQQSLIAEVSQQIARHPLNYWDELLDSIDCCYAPLIKPDELSQNPQIQVRKSLSESGPNYPGWINDAMVEIDDLVEIEHPETLAWE